MELTAELATCLNAGQVLTRQNIEDVVKFAKRENLLILADEVWLQMLAALTVVTANSPECRVLKCLNMFVSRCLFQYIRL